MAERWQTSEARVAAVYFEDPAGPTPLLGLSPTAVVYHKDGTGGAPTATVAEVGGGFYRVTLSAAPTKDLLVRVHGGTSTAGYAAQEIPVGGYVDDLATATALTAAAASLSAAIAAVQSDTDLLQVDTASLLARLTAGRAAALDLLDVAVSTRAS